MSNKVPTITVMKLINYLKNDFSLFIKYIEKEGDSYLRKLSVVSRKSPWSMGDIENWRSLLDAFEVLRTHYIDQTIYIKHLESKLTQNNIAFTPIVEVNGTRTPEKNEFKVGDKVIIYNSSNSLYSASRHHGKEGVITEVQEQSKVYPIIVSINDTRERVTFTKEGLFNTTDKEPCLFVLDDEEDLPEPEKQEGQLFSVGDIVYHEFYGEGTVTKVLDLKDMYPYHVLFNHEVQVKTFNKEGRETVNDTSELSTSPVKKNEEYACGWENFTEGWGM